MLIEFQAKNFGSLKNEQTLSMVASNYDKSRPNHIIDPGLPGSKGVKVIRSAAVYGANASGKSTVIRALAALRRIVVEPTGQDAETSLPYTPFLFDPSCRESPTEFLLIFAVDGVRYEYSLAHTDSTIVLESLSAYPKGKEQRWFHRELNSQNQTVEWSESSLIRSPRKLYQLVRPNSSLLSVAAQFNHPEISPVYEWFKYSLKVLNLTGGLAARFTSRQLFEQTELRQPILDLLRKSDVGVVGASVTEVDVETAGDAVEAFRRYLHPDIVEQLLKSDEKVHQVHLQHSGVGGTYPLDLSLESAGTQRIFSLAGPWFDVLTNGYTLLVDELDVSLHPLLVRSLLSMFHSTELNRKGAQLVFTTHDAGILPHLRRDQVWLVEKSVTGESQTAPLTDYKPRHDESLTAGYLAGRYGAVPILDEWDL